MKNCFYFLVLLVSTHFNVHGQEQLLATNNTSESEKVDGNKLIKNIHSKRKSFDKSKFMAALPAPEYIFNRHKATTISFNGLDYLVSNHEVVGIKGLNLSVAVLKQITEKLFFLDEVQYDYTQRCNEKYVEDAKSLKNNRNLERAFFLSLRILNASLRDIASFAKRNNSNSFAVNLSKMPTPNISLLENQATKALAQLNSK